jgi:hypothetical protein
MNIGPALVANPQPAEAREPGPRPLHYPAVAAQLLAALDAAARDARDDAPVTTRGSTMGGIVAFVGVQLGGPSAGTAQRTLDGRDGVQHGRQRQRVGAVSGAEAQGEGDAAPVDQQQLLRARLAAIRRIRAGNWAPLFAGTSRLSRHARDQSIWSASPRRSSRTRCRRSQTPAWCQSRNRRQQVTPLPQPISWGSISQGMPLCRTKSIPVKAARAGTRGRPPLGLAGSAGSSGSIKVHSSLLTRCLPILGYCSSPGPRF